MNINDEIKHLVCPACGYNYFKKKNYGQETARLMNNRFKSAKQSISKISKLIRENVPTDSTRSAFYYFLLGIKDCTDGEVLWGIDMFYKGRHYNQGKGYKYLQSIIKNRNKNLVKIAENERKRIGTAPPLVESITKGENNE
jgi:ribosomal protein L33